MNDSFGFALVSDFGVGVVQSLCRFYTEEGDQCGRWRQVELSAPAQGEAQVDAVDELHHQEELVSGATEVEDGNDVLVGQRHREPGLVHEELTEAGVAALLAGDSLDHELLFDPARAATTRQEDLGHSASGEWSNELVTAQLDAHRQDYSLHDLRTGDYAPMIRVVFGFARLSRLILVLTILGVAPALAQPVRPTVVVLSGAGATDGIHTSLRQLALRRGVALVDKRPPRVSPSTVRQTVERGVHAYQGFRYQGALKLFDQAVEALEIGDVVGVDPNVIEEVFIYRGLARFAVGDREAAWGDFVAAASVGPGRILDPVRFPPSAVETFERARREVAKAPRGAVNLQVPAGCKGSVDGVSYQGPRVVAHGYHFYGVQCRGQRVGGRFELSGELISLVPPLVTHQEMDVGSAKALARSRNAEQVVWVEVQSSESPTAFVRSVDLATGGARRVVVDAKEAPVNRAVIRMLEPPPELIGKAAPRKWYERPWVWAVAGAAVATAIVLPLTLGDSEKANFSVQPQGGLP